MFKPGTLVWANIEGEMCIVEFRRMIDNKICVVEYKDAEGFVYNYRVNISDIKLYEYR